MAILGNQSEFQLSRLFRKIVSRLRAVSVIHPRVEKKNTHK